MMILLRPDARPLFQPALLLLLGAALVVRLAAVLPIHSNGNYMSDERQYMNMAHRVLDGKGFVSENGERSTIAPLYIFLLAGVFKLVGSSLAVPHVLGCLLGVAIVLLTYWLCREVLGGGRIALLAAGAVAFHPSLVIYSGLLLTETLYMTFFLSAFLLAFKMVDRISWQATILFGIMSSLAALTRAVFFGFFPALLCLIWWLRKRKDRHGVKHLIFAAVVWGVVLVPWTVRNYNVHGTFVPVSTGGGKVLLTGNNPFAPKSWHAGGFEDWTRRQAAERGVKDLGALTEIELNTLYRELAIDYAVSEPVAVLLLMVQKVHIFSIYPITHSDSNIPLQGLATAADFLLYVGAVVGLAASWGQRNCLLPLFVATAFFLATAVVFHAEARFRLPLVPFMCLFFGSALSLASDKQRRMEFWRHKHRVFGSSVAIGFIVCVYVYTGVLFMTGKLS